MSSENIFSSTSVTAGHPDKLADQVSDAIVDAFLTGDPLARINCECAIANGVVFLATRYASSAEVALSDVARHVLGGAGYPPGDFNARECTVLSTVMAEPPAGAQRDVDLASASEEQLDAVRPREHVTVFGFACDQTEALMPLPIVLAHSLARRLAEVARGGEIADLSPDGQAQVAVEYVDGEPSRIHGISVVAGQTKDASTDLGRLRGAIGDLVLSPVFAGWPLRPDADTAITVNPDNFIVGGGPGAHAGLTGRKTGVDTYGEYARQSGSALSGKGPLRVDRVAAYAARYAAKNVVAAGLARQCEIQLTYAVARPGPVSVIVESFGTGALPDAELTRRVREAFDFRLACIVRDFRLQLLPRERSGVFYRHLAAYGHMGRTDLDAPWERVDRVDALGPKTAAAGSRGKKTRRKAARKKATRS